MHDWKKLFITSHWPEIAHKNLFLIGVLCKFSVFAKKNILQFFFPKLDNLKT